MHQIKQPLENVESGGYSGAGVDFQEPLAGRLVVPKAATAAGLEFGRVISLPLR